MVWTGRVDFEAQSLRKGQDRTVELMVRTEMVELLVDGRSYGYVDRDALRVWLARPEEPLLFDEAQLAITIGGMGFALIIGDTVLPMPLRVERQLRGVA